MKWRPDDEGSISPSIPSREAFYGVGSSHASLCPSPEDAHKAVHVHNDANYDAVSETANGHDNKDEPRSAPVSDAGYENHDAMVGAAIKAEGVLQEGDVDTQGACQNKDDGYVDEGRVGMENADGDGDDDDAESADGERLSHKSNAEVDVDVECHEPPVKDDGVDGQSYNGIMEEKLRASELQVENDDENPPLSHPPSKLAPTDSPSNILPSVSRDLRESSHLPRSREHSESGQQGSTHGSQSSMSRRHVRFSRKSSDASRKSIRSGRSSSESSSSGSSTNSESNSSSSDSESDAESNSSSGSSSSSDSSSCSSSDGESSDSESSSSGNDSKSSSSNGADDADAKISISAEKYRRTSRRGSGPSSSVSFAPDDHASMNTDNKFHRRRRHKTRLSYSTIQPDKANYLTNGIAQQETCSAICVIL